MNSLKIRAFVGLLMAAMLWGLSYVFSKGLIEAEMNNITIIFFRSLIASICLILIAIISRKTEFVKKEHLKTVVLLSIFQPFLYFIFELYSMKYNSAVLTSLIISLVPLFAPLLLYVVEGIKVSKRVFAAIAMSIIGVSVILLAGENGYQNLTTNLWGVVLAFIATFCAVIYSVIARRITQHYNALTITTYQNILGFVLFFPLFIFTENGQYGQIPLNESTIISLLLLGVFCSAFAYLFYLNSIKYLGVMVSTLTNNISPVFTVVGAYILFGQTLYPIQFLGVAITIGSLFVATIKRKSK